MRNSYPPVVGPLSILNFRNARRNDRSSSSRERSKETQGTPITESSLLGSCIVRSRPIDREASTPIIEASLSLSLLYFYFLFFEEIVLVSGKTSMPIDHERALFTKKEKLLKKKHVYKVPSIRLRLASHSQGNKCTRVITSRRPLFIGPDYLKESIPETCSPIISPRLP